jgi:DNA modification methylase
MKFLNKGAIFDFLITKIQEEFMEIKKISIKEINPAAYNPRKDLQPKDPEYQQIEASIDSFGLVQPLVWNKRSKNLVSGHQRLKILLKKGCKEVQASIVDLNMEREKALNLALNKVQGSWNQERLTMLLAELSRIPEFNLNSTGFTSVELGQLVDRYLPVKDGDCFDFEKAIKSVKEPITKRGEIISLKGHRLMCGDASSKEDLRKLFADEKISLLHIDWPYNVNYMGGSCPRVDTRPKKSRKWDSIYSDNMPQNEYEEFMRKVLINIKDYLQPGAAYYQWQAHKQLGPLYQILDELGFYVSCLICWAKESAAISYADYSFQTEQAVYGWLKGKSHYFAGEPGLSNLWLQKRDSTHLYQHPCQKPCFLAERAITNSSKRSDSVGDIMMGSGSFLIAAEALDRRCFGMELDPKYCDVIVQRFISYVGKNKVNADILRRYAKEGL